MKIQREVYRFVLYATTSSFAENVKVEYNGVRLTSVEGDIVEIKDRAYHALVEQVSGGKIKITIDVVNEDNVDFNDLQSIQNRIDCMIDEEYEPEVLATVITKSTNIQIPWTLELDECYQTQAMMDMDMAPGVKDAVSFITSSAVEFNDEFTATLIKEFNTGNYQHVLDFINTLAEL